MKLFKNTQMLVRVNNVSFYTTVNQIEEGVGVYRTMNNSIQRALEEIRKHDCLGVTATFNDIHVQLEIVK